MIRIDVAYMEANRLDTPEKVTALARAVITNNAVIVNDPDDVGIMFGLALRHLDIDSDAAGLIGALVGDLENVLDGMAINGLPVFGGVKLVHRGDLRAVYAELQRMCVALGIDMTTSNGVDAAGIDFTADGVPVQGEFTRYTSGSS